MKCFIFIQSEGWYVNRRCIFFVLICYPVYVTMPLKDGEDMEHKEYARINDKASTAVMFIHGIVGTPNHFNEFVSVVPQSVSVYNVLLDGHGKGVRDFSKTSMKKWEAQIASVVEELSLTHERIYIVAHSLGTLLAIDQAIHNEKICRLFLLAVPLRLSLKPKMASNSLKVYFDKIRSDDYEAIAAKKCYGIGRDTNPLHYIGWIPRFLELFAKIQQTRKVINSLNKTCWVYQSKKDEMVSGKSIKILSSNSNILLNELPNSGHYYYPKEDFDYLIAEFNKLISEVSQLNL